jgi:predicted ATPase/DNA-binding SARP family transcriptional activator
MESARDGVESGLFHIQLLGGFSIRAGNQVIPSGKIRLRKARSLLKLLALTPGHRLHRDQVIDLLWPDSDLDRAANSFYQTLYAVRKIIHSIRGDQPPFILLEDEFLFLNPDALPQVDALLYESAANLARAGSELAPYQQAIELYTGDLLPEDLYEEWTHAYREPLRQLHTDLLFKFAALCEATGDYQAGIDALQSLLASDPLNEEAHTELMRLYALSGQRHKAVRQYELLQDTLQRELGAEPDTPVRQLYQDILVGRVVSTIDREPLVETISSQEEPVKHNLPSRLSSFIGREKVIEHVRGLLEQSRLVTLLGPGGVGKTSLAIQVGFELVERFSDGVWLIELSSVIDPERIIHEIATVFQLRESRDRSLYAAVQSFLKRKQLLLILDNCEHLIDGCASLAESLLQNCPRLHILATSRETLGSEGETLYAVPTLSIPENGQQNSVEELKRFEAVRLFTERSVRALPGFELTLENGPTIVSICKQLDGLPLAIELAAARVGVLSVEGIAERLGDRFKLLTSGSRTALPRHQTIRASIDWSYELLSPEEKILLQRLSVFVGGWTMEAAEVVCGVTDVLQLLTQLVNKSLVVVKYEQGMERRYYLLETVRQYAAEKFASLMSTSPVEEAKIRNRHLSYLRKMVEESEHKLKTDERSVRMRMVRVELENIRCAISWSLDSSQATQIEDGLRLASSLHEFWYQYGFESEGSLWLERGLMLIEALSEAESTQYDLLKAKALWTNGLLIDEIGTMYDGIKLLKESLDLYKKANHLREEIAVKLDLVQMIWRHNRRESDELLEECIKVARSSGFKWELAYGLSLKAKDLVYFDKQNPEILTLAAESYSLFKETGDKWSTTSPLIHMGLYSLFQGNYSEARKYLLEAIALGNEMNDVRYQYYANINLGMLGYFEGDFQAMENYFYAGMKLTNNLSSWLGRIFALRNIAVAVNHQGDPKRAFDLLKESLRLAKMVNDPYGVLACLNGLAAVALSVGQADRAARLSGAVQAQLDQFTKPLDPIEKAEFDRVWMSLKNSLDDLTFNKYWRAGKAMDLEEALEEALKVNPENYL